LIGRHPLPSLELSIEEAVLACEAAFSCAYRNSISWKSPTQPLPMANNPRQVFEKLFGVGASDAERRARREESRSLLDSVMGQLASLQKDLPPGDRRRLDQALEDVREIERRINAPKVGGPGHHAGRRPVCADARAPRHGSGSSRFRRDHPRSTLILPLSAPEPPSGPVHNLGSP
jgi:hypothetical protein